MKAFSLPRLKFGLAIGICIALQHTSFAAGYLIYQTTTGVGKERYAYNCPQDIGQPLIKCEGDAAMAELYYGPANTTDANLLNPVPGSKVIFRTGSTAGLINGFSHLDIPNTLGGDVVTLQLRVWLTQNMTVTNWATALAQFSGPETSNLIPDFQLAGITSNGTPVLGDGSLATKLTLFACVDPVALDSDLDGLSDDFERGVGRYEVVLGVFTWQQAEEDAERRGGHLATVVSAREWEDMKSVLGDSIKGKNLWLGGTDEGTEGRWRWVTGELWKFDYWRTNEPSNDSLGTGHGAPENYLMIWGREVGAQDQYKAFWNDVPPTGGVLARDGYVFERGYWTDMNDPDTDDDGLSDKEEQFPGFHFEIVQGSFTWLQAKADAESRNGHLGTITSPKEWLAVQSLFTNSLGSGLLWLGANDLDQSNWSWITGEPFVFQNWANFQPAVTPGADYLAMHFPEGRWYNLGGTVAAYYLLERDENTDPNNPDTDGDGLKDGDEIKFYKTDPRSVDSDNDSLSDFEEIRRWHTNPLVVDTDGDQLSDADEIFTYHTNPLLADSDNDGFSDYLEIQKGSDPNSKASIPGVLSKISKALEIEIDSKVGQTYQIQLLTSTNTWANFGSVIPGTGGKINQIFSTKNIVNQGWRVVVLQ